MVLGKWGSLPDDCLWNRTPATVCNVPSHGRTAAGRLQLLCSTYVSPWMASFQTLQLCTWKVVLGANEWKRRVCEYILSLVWSEISDMRLLVLLIRFKYWDAIQSCSLTVLYCTVLYLPQFISGFLAWNLPRISFWYKVYAQIFFLGSRGSLLEIFGMADVGKGMIATVVLGWFGVSVTSKMKIVWWVLWCE